MAKKKPLVSIVIPIYNEAQTALKLLTMVYHKKSKNYDRELIIVESNSSDGSRQIVKNFVKGKKSTKLILQKKANGKSSALRAGFKASSGKVILIQDADLEYDISDHDKLIKPILDKKADFVLGSRHLKENNKFNWTIRRFKGWELPFSYVMNIAVLGVDKLFNTLYGTRLTDPNTMYKVFRRKLLDEIRLEGKFFEVDLELVSKFVRLGHIPLEIPVRYKSRSLKEGKKVNVLRDGFRAVKTIIKYRVIDKKRL